MDSRSRHRAVRRRPRRPGVPIGLEEVRKHAVSGYLVSALVAAVTLGLMSCRAPLPGWSDDEMCYMYDLASHAHACEATWALFRDKGADALPVFVGAFKQMQRREREHPGIHNTVDARLSMLANTQRYFRGDVEVMRILDALCENDPSPEIGELAGCFTKEAQQADGEATSGTAPSGTLN